MFIHKFQENISQSLPVKGLSKIIGGRFIPCAVSSCISDLIIVVFPVLMLIACERHTPIRDKIAISCMLRQIHEFSSHAIRYGLYIKNRKRLFCP